MRRIQPWKGLKLLCRKAVGLLLAVAGIALIIETLPTHLWLVLLGTFFIRLGWGLYGADRRRWL